MLLSIFSYIITLLANIGKWREMSVDRKVLYTVIFIKAYVDIVSAFFMYAQRFLYQMKISNYAPVE